MVITEWNLEEAQRAWLAQGRVESESKILGLFKQGIPWKRWKGCSLVTPKFP